MLRRLKIASLLLGLMAGAQVLAEESPYTFTRGFPANDETIKY